MTLPQTETPPSLSPRPKAKQKTFEQVFELFINDPTRKRAKKTIAGYRDGIEIIYAVVGRETLIGDIDREVCRRLLETLQWLPTNSPKKFPTLTVVQAAKLARQKGQKDLLGPVSINGYMIMLSSILNFAINEELIERNPCRGLRVIDPIKKRDKRLNEHEFKWGDAASTPEAFNDIKFLVTVELFGDADTLIRILS